MSKKWTEIAIRRKRFDGRVTDFSIQGGSGLFFRVTEHGSYFKWRAMSSGNTFRRNIGTVHDIPFSEALEIARRFRANFKKGLPPEYGSISNTSLTFQEAYEAYIASVEFGAKKPNYRNSFCLRMEKWVVEGNELTPTRSALNRANLELRKNKIGNIQIANLDQITARKFWSHISNVGNSNAARLVKSHCKIIVDWACHHHFLEIPTNPFGFSAPRISKVSRDRVFSLEELKKIITAFKAEPIVRRQFFNVCLLTGWRNGEIARMRWKDIEYDVPVSLISDNDTRTVAIWNAPPETTKSNRSIRFLLTDRLVNEIDSLKKINCWVFTYNNRGSAGESLPMHPPRKRASQIMSELGLSGSATTHTLRHTAVTYLKEIGFSAAAVDRFLGKTVREGSASHSIYNHSDGLAEKLAVAEGWEKTLLSLGFGAKNE